MQGVLSRTAVGLVVLALISPIAAAQQGQTREPAPVIVEVRDDGFDWGAAGIGAVGGFGLALIASSALGRLGMRRRPLGHARWSWNATARRAEGDTHANPPSADDRSRASGAVPKGDPR